jgi:hypothetical protein
MMKVEGADATMMTLNKKMHLQRSLPKRKPPPREISDIGQTAFINLTKICSKMKCSDERTQDAKHPFLPSGFPFTSDGIK